MVLELAILNVIPGREGEFERAFREAKGIIASMQGFQSLDLQKCVEQPNRYALLVQLGEARGPHRRVPPVP